MTAEQYLLHPIHWAIFLTGILGLVTVVKAFLAIEGAVKELARKNGCTNTQARAIIYPSKSYSIDNPFFRWNNMATWFTSARYLITVMIVWFCIAMACLIYIAVTASAILIAQ